MAARRNSLKPGPSTEESSGSPSLLQRPRIQWWLPNLGAFLLGGLCFLLITVSLLPDSVWSLWTSQHSPHSADAASLQTNPELWRLATLSDEELSEIDIARMNLTCATGLPGADALHIDACLRKLDSWAAAVRFDTERHLYKFRQNPAEYQGSEGYFRMLMLVTVLQRDLGVRYNQERIRDIDFSNSSDLFIHGMLGLGDGGTCVSMPVLYTAVARRLGYPVKLVLAKAHVFCRWHDDQERINLEATGPGLSIFPDTYYQSWPHPISNIEVAQGHYLQSLTPRQELAVFLSARAHCLQDTGRRPEALAAYAHAHALDPQQPETLAFLEDALRRSGGASEQQRVAARRYEQAMEENLNLRNQINRERREREMSQLMEQTGRYQTDPWTPPQPLRGPGFPNAPSTAVFNPAFPFEPAIPQ